MTGPEAEGGSGNSESHNVGGKGKGKAVVARGSSDHETNRPMDDGSVLSRLGKSAAGLSRSVLQGAPLAKDLTTAALSSGKAAAPSSSSKFDARAETPFAAAAPSPSGSASFRPAQAHAHASALELEAAFSDFLDHKKALNLAWEAACSKSTNAATNGSIRGAVASSVSKQQERDGVEVVRLLSQFDADTPVYEAQVQLSEGEWKSLRRALFEDGAPSQVTASDWNNVLNFIPDFLDGQDGSHDGTGAPESMLMNLGLTDTAAAGQQWLTEWNRVLTSYNDEVWGDLGDLVHQAQAEVQKMRDSQEGQRPDPTALRRLRTVLTRVRARL